MSSQFKVLFVLSYLSFSYADSFTPQNMDLEQSISLNDELKNMIAYQTNSAASKNLQNTNTNACSTAPTQNILTDPNPSDRFGTKNRSNTYVSGEIIWLQPLNGQIRSEHIKNDYNGFLTYGAVDNRFKQGFRLALGYNMPYDGWNTYMMYTGWRYKHNNPFYFSNLDEPINSKSGTITQVYYYDQGDLDMGRMYKISSKYRIRPHAGVRLLWLTQKVSADYIDIFFTNESDHVISRFKGTLVGLEAGLESYFSIYKGFSAYFNFGFTSLVNSQKESFLDNFTDLETTPVVSKSTNYSSKLVNGYDLALGLRWDKKFGDDNYHFNFNAGYELHSLININTNQALLAGNFDPALASTNPTWLNLSQDFTVQGVALGARIDF